MYRYLPVLALLVIGPATAHGRGILIPVDKSVPPLAMLNHLVKIRIEDQVAVTRVEQTFRNHTDRALEATYVFPVPRGASLRQFSLWVNDHEQPGELIEAAKARQIYTDIVRRTQDPALLEYMDGNLLRLRIFPVPPHGDQRVALSFTAVASEEAGLIEYVYPLRTSARAAQTLEKFSLDVDIHSQHPILNVYSPTHAITLTRASNSTATVKFEQAQATLDRDFRLYYSVGDQDVGLTALAQRPQAGEAGFVMLLLSPKVDVSPSQIIPRDMVLVLDTSGSMRGAKMDQARKALQYCLANLGPRDRFGLINFATTVNRYNDGLVDATSEQLESARHWVDQLEATGGTAIDDALSAALQMRTTDAERAFTIVFFTDGCPTIGETNPERILKNVAARNSANTRIFTFGVGDDVNATMLDELALGTRAQSTYVRPTEDIQAKVSGLYAKISHPVLTNLKLTAEKDVQLSEIYPPQLPDLFQGGQLVVLARYRGQGSVALRLTGTCGKDRREYVYELKFPEKTTEDRSYVEHVWARRKVGYLLDQIRANGEKKELVDETVALAKKYGIATPYTSYLVVPDGPVPLAQGRDAQATPYGFGGGGFGGGGSLPPPVVLQGAAGAPLAVETFARQVAVQPGNRDFNLAGLRERAEELLYRGARPDARPVLERARAQKEAYLKARQALGDKDVASVQMGKLGVDLSVQTGNLRNQTRLDNTLRRSVLGRNCQDVGGVWMDEDFDAKMPTIVVKAMSEAYFQLLERHPQLKALFELGNHLVWVSPSGTALVIDTQAGKENLAQTEIDGLFKGSR
jgi:Ca-activated chloride channel family protein